MGQFAPKKPTASSPLKKGAFQVRNLLASRDLFSRDMLVSGRVHLSTTLSAYFENRKTPLRKTEGFGDP